MLRLMLSMVDCLNGNTLASLSCKSFNKIQFYICVTNTNILPIYFQEELWKWERLCKKFYKSMVLCLPNCTRDDFMVAPGLNWIHLHFSLLFSYWLCIILDGLTNPKWCPYWDLVVKLQVFTTCLNLSASIPGLEHSVLSFIRQKVQSSDQVACVLWMISWEIYAVFCSFKPWDHYLWYSQAETDVYLSEDVTEGSSALVEV